MIVPMYFQYKVKSTYNKYSRVRSTSGKTGREVAEEILAAMNFQGLQMVFMMYKYCKVKGSYQITLIRLRRE